MRCRAQRLRMVTAAAAAAAGQPAASLRSGANPRVLGAVRSPHMPLLKSQRAMQSLPFVRSTDTRAEILQLQGPA
jgi:hypothetical protein